MKRDIVGDFLRVFRLAYNRGLISGTEGNGSVKTDEGFLITRSGVSKGMMEPDDILLVDETGKVREGEGKPSSEIRVHLSLYRALPDLRAVVHTHAPYSVAYSLLEDRFPLTSVSELFLVSKGLEMVPYAPPSSERLARNVASVAEGNDLFILEKHGTVSLGHTLFEAYLRTESLEQTMMMTMIGKAAGRLSNLSEEDIRELRKARQAIRPRDV